MLYSGDSITARYLTALELDWLWAATVWDLTDPVIVFDNGRYALVVDFMSDGGILYAH